MTSMQGHMQVQKLDTQGHITVTYEAEVAERLPDGVRLEARWTRPTLPLGYTTFETGDRFVEWFFSDRWYNIFEISAAGGALKGWYCNVAEPAAISSDTIACRDLLLDVWVTPDGATRVLDEDEFAADTTLDEQTRNRARAALDELLRLVRDHAGPFARIATGEECILAGERGRDDIMPRKVREALRLLRAKQQQQKGQP